MPSQLDEVCKKYGYKGVNVATWRDPSLSVLAGGRGPRSGYMVAPADVSKPFIPTYKVKYPVPEPTDDESSGDEMKDERHNNFSDREDETLADSPLQAPGASLIDDKPKDGILEPSEQPWTDDVIDDVPDNWDFNENVAEPQQNNGEVLAEAESTPDMANTTTSAAPDVPVEVIAEAAEDVGDLERDIPPPVAEEHSEEKKVAFAPDTPEPKQTQRKKKGGKAAKSKKKRSTALVADDPPEDPVAADSAADAIPPPPPDPPASFEHENALDADHEDAEVMIAEAAPEDEGSVVTENDVPDAAEASGPPAEEGSNNIAGPDGDVHTVTNAELTLDIADGQPSEEPAPAAAEIVDPFVNREPQADAEPNVEDIPPPPPAVPAEEEWPDKSSKKKGKKASKKKAPKAQPESEPETTAIDEPSTAAPQIDPVEGKSELTTEPVEPVLQEAEPTDESWAPATLKKKKAKKSEKVADAPSRERVHDATGPADAVAEPLVTDDAQPEPEPEPEQEPEPEPEAELSSAEPLSPPPPPAPFEAEAELEDKSSKKKGKKASKKEEAKAKALEAFASAGALDSDVPEERKQPPAEDLAAESKEDGIVEPVGGEPVSVDRMNDADAEEVNAAPENSPADDAPVAAEEESEAAVDAIGDVAEDEAASPTDSGVATEEREKDGAADDAAQDVRNDDVKGENDTVEEEAAEELIPPTADESSPASGTESPECGAEANTSPPTNEEPLSNGDQGENAAALEENATKMDKSLAEFAAPADDEKVEVAPDEEADAGLSDGNTQADRTLTVEALDGSPVNDGPENMAALESGENGVAVVAEAIAAEEVAKGEFALDDEPSQPRSADPAASDDMFAGAAQDEDIAPDEQPPDPPSPALTKTTSRGSHKSTHWDRPHQTNRLREALEGPVALKRPHGHRTGSRDEVVHCGERKHRSRRDSVTMDKDRERKGKDRKRTDRKRDDATAAARIVQEERRKVEDEVARRRRHEARRRDRAAAKEEDERIARKEAERDAERRRKRRHEREMREIDRREEELRAELREKGKAAKAREMEDDRSSRVGGAGAPTARPPRSSMSSTSSARPILAKMFTGESVHRTGFLVSYGPGGGDEDDRPASRRSKDSAVSSLRGSPRMERTKTSPASVISGLESLGEGGSAHGSRRRDEGEYRHRRRPTMEKEKEKPKSFLGSLFTRSS